MLCLTTTILSPRLSHTQNVGAGEWKEKSSKFKRSITANSPEPPNQNQVNPSPDLNNQSEDRKSRSTSSSAVTKDNVPIPANCELDNVRKIFMKKGDLGNHIYLLDKFSLFQLRINTLKLINSFHQSEKTINGHTYTTSTSPLLATYCLFRGAEGSLFNTHQQETFLEDFQGSPNHSLTLDYFFLGQTNCLLSHPVPMLFKEQEYCINTLTNLTNHLNLADPPDPDHLTKHLNGHSMAPLFLSTTKYHTTTPEVIVCPSRIIDFDYLNNIFRRQYDQLKTKMMAVDKMLGSDLEQSFLTFLDSDCGLQEDIILQQSIPVMDIKNCGVKLLESRKTRVRREVKLVNIETSPLFKIGPNSNAINKDFAIIRGNQDVLEMELAKLKTGQKILYGVGLSLSAVLHREENIVHGAAVQASVNKHLSSQIASFKAASAQVKLDNEVVSERLDNFIKQVQSKVTRDILCQNAQCAIKNSTSFYTHENGLLAITSEEEISSKNILVIKCPINDDLLVPAFNLGQIDKVLPKTVRVIKNHAVSTYTHACMKDPEKCNLMMNLEPTALTHGVYLSIRGKETIAQCPKKIVLTDQDPKARTKTCHLTPITVRPPIHLPASNVSIGEDMLTSISFLDMPTTITLTRLNLLYHSQKLDMAVNPALHWLWDKAGNLRKIVKVPTNHFFSTLACLAVGFAVMTLACCCYLCRCCGCAKVASCLSCRSRTVTVEREQHDPHEPPSRSFTRILATSCNCCRHQGRSDSLDIVQIAGSRPPNEANEQALDHEAGLTPTHSNMMRSLSRSVQLLDKHLESAPPAYHSSPGPPARGDHDQSSAPTEATSFSVTPL